MSRLIVVLLSLLCALATANRSDSSESKQKALSSPFPTLDVSCFQDIQFSTKFYYYPVTKDSKENIYFQGYGVYNNQNTSVIFGNFDLQSNLYNFVLYYTDTGRSRVYNFVQVDVGYKGALTYLINAKRTAFDAHPHSTSVTSCNSITGGPSSEFVSKQETSSNLPSLSAAESCFYDIHYGDKFYYHSYTKDYFGNIYFQGYGVYNNQNTSTIFGNYDSMSIAYSFVIYFDSGRSRVYNFVQQSHDTFINAITYGVNDDQSGYYSNPQTTTVFAC